MSSLIDSLLSLNDAERSELLASLTDQEANEIVWSWDLWARDNQLAPAGDWLTWLILAGRGFGKTRTGAETIRDWVCGKTPLAKGKFSRIALVAETAADARDVMVEGDSGLLSVHPKEFRPIYEPSKRRLTWPNGAVATLYNATEPDQLRGPQHDAAWSDELAKWKYAEEAWDQLQFGLRLGVRPRQIVTTTPRPIPVLKDIVAAPDTVVTKGSTYDNVLNLAPSFLKKMQTKYEGTRLGRQELAAEILDDLPGALWDRNWFDEYRVKNAPVLTRILVSIDPSGADGEEDSSDDIGIIVAGVDEAGHGYIIGDYTVNEGPAGWGKQAIRALQEKDADMVVAETNFGGAMVKYVIHSIDPNIPFKEVKASRGKAVRAEPVAAMYEQGRVHHVGSFPQLEDQMCLMGLSGYVGRGSPDRLDAAVWALSELMLTPVGYDYEIAL